MRFGLTKSILFALTLAITGTTVDAAVSSKINKSSAVRSIGTIIISGLSGDQGAVVAGVYEDEKSVRNAVNTGRVTLITGGLEYVSNTYMTLAVDLASKLNERGKLRILPLAGLGSISNVEDLLYLKGIDVGMVHSDVLTHLDQIGELPAAKERLRYIVSLYDEFFHVLAHKSITDVTQLAGRKVAVAKPGTGGEMSALTLFALLDVKPNFVHFPWKEAVAKIESGDLAAMIYPTRKPSKVLTEIDQSSELHILPLPLTKEMQATYEKAEFSTADYPNLISASEVVPTLKFDAVLAVYNWGKNQKRYGNILKFVNSMFANLENLKDPSHHNIWRNLDPSAPVLGWKRYEPVDQLLQKLAKRNEDPRTSDASTGDGKKDNLFLSYERFVKVMRAEGALENHTEEDILRLYLRFTKAARKL